ncbi:shikimate dehydrogenase [Deinococcus sp.]|uniref:shikimate dehydrogenase n=1 Tax=Deinococcus sp. TaxID=47478 RepID=UPI0025C25678|nr:shikimate dehydrogenase [Deinococcus sp.]
MSSTDVPAAYRTYLYADPAAHSLSPLMHRAAFAAAGLRGDYEAVRVTPAELADRVARLRAPDVLGANLSLPHKETVLPLLDDLTPAARAIGAVNTVINRAGRLIGDNTDAPGLLAALNAHDMLARSGSVLILGAGGAARAAVYAATQQGRSVYIVNRTPDNARRLAGAFAGARAARLPEVPWADISLVINSSSAGLDAPWETPLPEFDFGQLAGTAVYDMVYKPAPTRLIRDARAAGLRAENGLGMLAHQARLAFEAWTGAQVPAGVFLQALGGEAAVGEQA